MSEFEHKVIRELAVLEERTRDLPALKKDVADIKGRVRLLEFKAGMFGSLAGGVIVGIKYLLGRS